MEKVSRQTSLKVWCNLHVKSKMQPFKKNEINVSKLFSHIFIMLFLLKKKILNIFSNNFKILSLYLKKVTKNF